MTNMSRLLLSFASVFAFVPILHGQSSASREAGSVAYLTQAEEQKGNSVLDRPISLTLDGVPLAEAIGRIAAASGVTLAFSPSQAG